MLRNGRSGVFFYDRPLTPRERPNVKATSGWSPKRSSPVSWRPVQLYPTGFLQRRARTGRHLESRVKKASVETVAGPRLSLRRGHPGRWLMTPRRRHNLYFFVATITSYFHTERGSMVEGRRSTRSSENGTSEKNFKKNAHLKHASPQTKWTAHLQNKLAPK